MSLWILIGFGLLVWGLLKELFNLPTTIREKKQIKELEESYRQADLRRRERKVRVGALYLMQEQDEILSGNYASPTIIARAIWEITEINNEKVWVKDILGWKEKCVSKESLINNFQNVDDIFDSYFLYGNELLSNYEKAIELLKVRRDIIRRRIEQNKGKD